MTRGREVALRIALTLGVLAALALALTFSGYAWDFQPPWRYRNLFLQGIQRTVSATALAYVLGLSLGLVVALARMSRRLWARHLGDMYVELIRGTPVLVQLGIAYWGIAPIFGYQDKFVIGTLALGVFIAAYIGEILRAGIESVERGQVEAARSLGLSRGQTLRHVVLPQAFVRMIPPLTSELIALTKESSLLYTIGLFELMAAARQVGTATYRNFEALLIVAAMYLTLTIPLSLLSRALERRLGQSAPARVHL